MNIKQALKKLNKDVAEADQFKISSSRPSEYFVTDYITTSSPYLDYKINGGIPKGRFTIFVGGEGSGKTSIALLTSKAIQEEGKYVVYFDGEGTVNQSYMERFNINPELFIHHKTTNLEEMLDAAEVFSTSEDVGMIIIDSIPSFTSTVIEDKSAKDDTMAVDARKYNMRMPVIYGNCTRRDIVLLAINFYKKNPGAMGDPNVLPRGEWQKYMASIILQFNKKNNKVIVDKDKNTIGVTLEVKIKKSKLHKANAYDSFDVNFYYDFGFDMYDEYASLLVEKGVIEKRGAWYYLPNGDKEQGILKIADYLQDNTEYLSELITKLENDGSTEKEDKKS